MGNGPLGADSNEVLFVDPTSPQIHQAAAFGNVEDLEHELAVGWHVDMTDNYGRTALHHAALNGNLDACSLLMDRGARLDARARDGKTPFNYAAQNCKAEALRLLHMTARRTRATNREANTKDGQTSSSQRERAFAAGAPVADHGNAPTPATPPASGGRSEHSRKPPPSDTQADDPHDRALTSTTASSLHAHAPHLGGSKTTQAHEGVGADGSSPTDVGLTGDKYLLNERLIRQVQQQHATPKTPQSRKTPSPGKTVRGASGNIWLPSPAGLQASPSPDGSGQASLPNGLSLSLPNRVTWRDEMDAKAGGKSGPSLVETVLL